MRSRRDPREGARSSEHLSSAEQVIRLSRRPRSLVIKFRPRVSSISNSPSTVSESPSTILAPRAGDNQAETLCRAHIDRPETEMLRNAAESGAGLAFNVPCRKLVTRTQFACKAPRTKDSVSGLVLIHRELIPPQAAKPQEGAVASESVAGMGIAHPLPMGASRPCPGRPLVPACAAPGVRAHPLRISLKSPGGISRE